MQFIEFLRHWARNPAMVGAVAPSSRRLARAMARGIEDASLIVELGSGTGAITDELVRHCDQQRMVLIEPDATLARHLSRRYPQARVMACCAHELPEFFAQLPEDAVLVSSLPFRSLPPEVSGPTIELLLSLLGSGRQRRLIQYTYHPRAPFQVPRGFHWHRRERVLGNLPPAGVWELCAREAAPVTTLRARRWRRGLRPRLAASFKRAALTTGPAWRVLARRWLHMRRSREVDARDEAVTPR